MKKILILFLFFFQIGIGLIIEINAQEPFDSGISGVYEVILAVDDIPYSIRYWGDYGFRVVDSAEISAKKAMELYGVDSQLKVFRLQN